MRKWSSSPGYQQQQRVIPAQRITKPSWANDKYNTSIPFHHGLPSSWNFRGFPYVLSTIFECLMVDGCLVNFPTHFSTLRCILPLDPAGLSVAHHHNHQRTIPEERLDAMVIAMVKSITAIPLKKKTSKFASLMRDVQLLPHLWVSYDLQVLVTLLPKVFTFGFSLPSICGLVGTNHRHRSWDWRYRKKLTWQGKIHHLKMYFLFKM